MILNQFYFGEKMSKLKEKNNQEKMNCIDSEKEKINDELLEKDRDIKT